jgi:hypothetical protein
MAIRGFLRSRCAANVASAIARARRARCGHTSDYWPVPCPDCRKESVREFDAANSASHPRRNRRIRCSQAITSNCSTVCWRAQNSNSTVKANCARHTACDTHISACAQIAKNCRASVEMIEKHYAAHSKDTLDATAINVVRGRSRRLKISQGRTRGVWSEACGALRIWLCLQRHSMDISRAGSRHRVPFRRPVTEPHDIEPSHRTMGLPQFSRQSCFGGIVIDDARQRVTDHV